MVSQPLCLSHFTGYDQLLVKPDFCVPQANQPVEQCSLILYKSVQNLTHAKIMFHVSF